MRKKILLFANTDWYLYNFRKSLALELRARGADVTLVSPTGKYGAKFAELGIRWIPLEFDAGGTNPLREMVVIFRFWRLVKQIDPAIIHNFTIKCVLYGSIGASVLGRRNVINALTGLGHVYTDTGWSSGVLQKVISFVFRGLLSGPNRRTVFQNSRDMAFFVERGIISADQSRLIRGSGVDTRRFAPSEYRKRSKSGSPVKILFASRLLREKGIIELVDAIKLLQTWGCEFSCVVAGDIYPGNPSSLSSKEVTELSSMANVNYVGHVDDIYSLLCDCDVVVLPSYAEGTPRILLEAASMNIPIVATDIAGCRGVVREGINGILIRPRDSVALAKAMRALIENEEERTRLGRSGRRIVVEEFDERVVLEKTLAVYKELGFDDRPQGILVS